MRICVICGGSLTENTPEHIIPDWLIRLTGDRDRIVDLGPQKRVEGYPERRYSFSSFVFPSCRQCNKDLAQLEDNASSVMKRILADEMLAAADLFTLMDWFDKVRVGLRLGYHILDENPEDVQIRHYIRDAIGKCDRALAVYRDDSTREMLAFFQTDTPLFGIYGNCFLLRVNNYWFLSMASPFLVSRRIGLPFPELFEDFGDRLHLTLREGLERIIIPVLAFRVPPGGTLFYQAQFGEALHDQRLSGFYRSKYVSQVSTDADIGVGKLFLEPARGKPLQYPEYPEHVWSPSTLSLSSIGPYLVRDTLRIQRKLCDFEPTPRCTEKGDTRERMRKMRSACIFNRERAEWIGRWSYSDWNGFLVPERKGND